jgi:hypothetical protein
MNELLINIIIGVCSFFGVSLCGLITWQLNQLILVTKDNSAQTAKVHVQGVENYHNINTLIKGQNETTNNIGRALNLISRNTERIIIIETKLEPV